MRKIPSRKATGWDLLETPIGVYGFVSGEKGLVEIFSAPSEAEARARMVSRYPGLARGGDEILLKAVAQVKEYFDGRRQVFSLGFDFDGLSPFAVEVLKNLMHVPFGRTVSYGHLASVSGRPNAARAVGRIMAGNPFPVVIPCHRVMGADGRLTGYSGGKGIETKKWLLRFENLDPASKPSPAKNA